MSENGHPVTVAVTRPDGSVEQVRVGTAFKQGEGFRLVLGDLSIGGAPEAAAPRRAAAAPAYGDSSEVTRFPNYGRSKGGPIAGASEQDLDYYAKGARRSLDDPTKSRWHDRERALLAAIDAELTRQHGGAPGGSSAPSRGPSAPDHYGELPPPGEEDIPF